MEGQIKFFPNKVQLKEFIIIKPLLYEKLKGLIYEMEDDQKLCTVKWQHTHNYQQMNLKKKRKLSKQLEQEQNQRNGHHMEGLQWGRGGEE